MHITICVSVKAFVPLCCWLFGCWCKHYQQHPGPITSRARQARNQCIGHSISMSAMDSDCKHPLSNLMCGVAPNGSVEHVSGPGQHWPRKAQSLNYISMAKKEHPLIQCIRPTFQQDGYACHSQAHAPPCSVIRNSTNLFYAHSQRQRLVTGPPVLKNSRLPPALAHCSQSPVSCVQWRPWRCLTAPASRPPGCPPAT